MTTPLLEVYHHLCQFFTGHRLSFPALADVMVLAELTGKVAVGYKDRPGAVASNQRWLFTKMRSGT
jgi:hypothetical protein